MDQSQRQLEAQVDLKRLQKARKKAQKNKPPLPTAKEVADGIKKGKKAGGSAFKPLSSRKVNSFVKKQALPRKRGM